MIRYFIKHKKHKNWTKMSLSTIVPISAEEAKAYVKQYADDRLHNAADYEIRGQQDDGIEIVYPLSGFTDPLGENGVYYPWAL